MTFKQAYYAMVFVAVIGVLFSGYLTYYNLWGPGCEEAVVSCGTKPVEIFGQPTCVYGFFMYLFVLGLSLWILNRPANKPLRMAALIVSLIGTLFAGSLTVYELGYLGTSFSDLPSCAYGFVIYAVLFAFSIAGIKKQVNPSTHGHDPTND